jgi:hypothetical protein
VVEIERVGIVISGDLTTNMVYIIEIVSIMVDRWRYLVYGNVVLGRNYHQGRLYVF